MSDFFHPIVRLHRKGYTPKGILDIGAHKGMFAGNLHGAWPDAKALLFEANPAMEPALKKLGLPYRICLLGRENKMTDFFVDPQNPESTGNSIFIEQTEHFKDATTAKLPMHRLDDVIDDVSAYDFMKLDVQGAELEVLEGAPNTLKHLRFVFAEVTLRQYNKGAPLFYEVHHYMHEKGFQMVDLCELTVIDGALFQFNVLFERLESPAASS
jgi:FkbM family methyltransferase